MNDAETRRLKEIMEIARKLKWIVPIPQPNVHDLSYPLMQLSEVEKCMAAMIDDRELERMRTWGEEVVVE